MHKNLATIVATFFSLAVVTSASALPHLGSGSQPPKTLGRVFIGYNGFSGDPRPPQASTGGELGAVFYIADAVDLAKFFANGANHAKDTVCLIHADATEWARVPKTWVPASVLAGGGAAVNKFAPGAVVFAPHTNAGLPAGALAHVYQLGIRQAQIARLLLTTDCRHKSTFPDNQHQTLDYPSLNAQWNIQPAFGLWEEWREVLMRLVMAPTM
ncbi:hypothetical protein BJ912DRAFT_993875 [Pholiota molesta]|nr:hypothetical protein BJ912DRAFT_993875 [Pholiota molesta]